METDFQEIHSFMDQIIKDTSYTEEDRINEVEKRFILLGNKYNIQPAQIGRMFIDFLKSMS